MDPQQDKAEEHTPFLVIGRFKVELRQILTFLCLSYAAFFIVQAWSALHN
jgi:hypothetical protein